jgi:hypothetical protein
MVLSSHTKQMAILRLRKKRSRSILPVLGKSEPSRDIVGSILSRASRDLRGRNATSAPRVRRIAQLRRVPDPPPGSHVVNRANGIHQQREDPRTPGTLQMIVSTKRGHGAAKGRRRNLHRAAVLLLVVRPSMASLATPTSFVSNSKLYIHCRLECGSYSSLLWLCTSPAQCATISPFQRPLAVHMHSPKESKVQNKFKSLCESLGAFRDRKQSSSPPPTNSADLWRPLAVHMHRPK